MKNNLKTSVWKYCYEQPLIQKEFPIMVTLSL